MATYTCNKLKFLEIAAHAIGGDLTVISATLVDDVYTLVLSEAFTEEEFAHIFNDIDPTFTKIN